MADEKEPSCHNNCINDPNFAIICSFFDRFGSSCGITHPTFSELQEMIENYQEVQPELIELHVKLLRKIRRSVSAEKWERALIKFCHSYYCSEEGWELECGGYKKCKVPARLRILKTLLDAQFDLNSKFKTDVNKLSAEELRLEPLGRDKVGQSYWCQFDSAANIRVYKEDQDEETWKLVAKDREGLVDLITQLSSGEELLGLELINEEDSNSQEVEKPIIDTGQVEMSTSEENTADNISSIDTNIENNVKNEDQLDSKNHPENALSVEVKNTNGHTENVCDRSDNNSSEKELVELSSKETIESKLENAEDNECSKNDPNLKLEGFQTNTDNSNITSSNLDHKEFSEDNSIEKCNSAKESETDCIKTFNTEEHYSNLSKSSETDRIDVAEEIKQRSLIKSNSSTVFQGKVCKPALVSKLDKIFSHKLESGNVMCAESSNPIAKPSQIEEEKSKVPDVNQSKKEDEEVFHKETVKHRELSDSDNKRKEREFENSIDSPLPKKQCLGTELSEEVGEEIEEPVMLIKGEGSGRDCDTGNLGREKENIMITEMFSDEVEEEIEEPIMIIIGEGYGHDCDTGNPSREGEEDVETKEKINIVTPDKILLKNKVNDQQQISSDKCKGHNENSNHDERDAGIGLITRAVENNEGSRDCLINDIDVSKENYKVNEIVCTDKETLVVNNKLKDKLDDSKVVIESQNSSQPDEEHEQSIEEQLSFLTGESLSPQQNSNENLPKVECIEENSSHLLNNYSDKGVRRKSKEHTSQDDKDATPPEAKKTKVGNDKCENLDLLDTNSTQLADIIDTLMGKQDNSTHNKLNNQNVEVRVSNFQTKNYASSTKENESNKSQDTLINDISSSINNANAEITSEVLSSSNNKADESSGMEGESEIVQDNSIKKNDDSTSVLNQLTKDEKKSQKMTGNNKKKVNKKSDSTQESSSKHQEVNGSTNENPNDKVSSFKENVILKESTMGSSNTVEGETISTSLDKETSDNIKSNSTITDNNLNTENSVENAVTNTSNKIEEENKSETNLLKSENCIESSCDSSILKCEKSENTLEKKTTPKKSPKPRKKLFTPKSRKRMAKALENKLKKETTIENSSENKETIQSNKKDDTNQNSCDDEQNTVKSESQMEVIDNIVTKNNSALKGNRKRRSTRRNTGTEKDSEDDATSDKKEEENKDNVEEVKEIGGKRRKIKGKRPLNKALRKYVEEKRKSNLSSEEESQIKDDVQNVKKSPVSPKQRHGKGKSAIKNIGKNSRPTCSAKKKKEDEESSNDAEDVEQASKKTKPSKSLGRNSRAFLGIDLNIDINETSRSVRQSSRLAQIKIKEQVDGKIVDESHKKYEKSPKKSSKKKVEIEEKQKGTPKKQKKTKMEASEDDIQEEDLSDRKKKKKKKKKHPVKAFNERDPWKSSSGSSSEAEEEEEEYHFDDIVEEEEDIPVAIKSDHEFSPESDLEGDEEVKPIRHARTAQKTSDQSAEEGDADDFACEKCGKKDHPEWILLCDTCDQGWHASCLRPSLMLIPEGDWHCPPCQHAVLVRKLQETLKIFDRDSKRRENEELRKKRLAYVGISLDNVLPSNAHPHQPHEAREKGSGSESSQSSESESRSESEESDEPVYQLRQRRQGTNTYRFSEFDELINSAIQDEVAGKNAVFAIVPENATQNVEKPEVEVNVTENKDEEVKEVNGLEESKPPASCDEKKEDTDKPIKKDKEKSDEDEQSSSSEEDDEEEEFPHVVPKRVNILPRPGKKKHRRLNCLDDASDDDDGSDEDFKGSSSEEEDEEEEDEDSDESGTGRRKSKRGHIGPVRRSSRTRRSRFDKEFINDDDSEESDAPRRKKTKKLWSESDSESDDSTWGRRKKKKNQSSSGRRKFKKNKKFVIDDELSETETTKVPKKKRQRKIKYGGLDDLSVEDLPSRRTRGKKINYQEVLGSDSDEDIQKPKSVRKAIIHDDEFVAEKGEKEDSESLSSGEDEDAGIEENSCDGQSNEKKVTDKKSPEGEFQKKDLTTVSSVKPPTLLVRPVEDINKGKFSTAKKVKPPKAMIAPPPERLVSEDEQYKAIVSKVSTLTHSESEIKLARPVNFNDQSNSSSESRDFSDHLTPIKIQTSSLDQKFMKRSPPIKIRSGVPVNAAGRKSPLASPTGEVSFFPVKQMNLEPIHSPPDKIQSELGPQKSQGLIQASAHQFVSSRKTVDPIIKTEKLTSEVVDNGDEDDYLDDIEEEEEDDEDDSEDDLLEEGEIPKKVARRMARMEERMLRQQDVKPSQVKAGKHARPAAPLSPGAVQPPTSSASEQKPLLRVVSPLKLMANPPGPLQSSFLNSGMGARMPIPPPQGQSRMAMAIRPPQPTNMMPGMNTDDGSPKRRGRGRGKKQPEKPEQELMAGGSVIRGMLQQPQSYPPTHYPQHQQYPPHPRIPFNPQRMPRPPFHPVHHPLDPSPSGGGTVNIKQEPASNPSHIANKPPPSSGPPYHPTAAPPHLRLQNYPPQPPKAQYNSYPPPPGPGPSTNYHYGSYPPPPSQPQGYPVQQQPPPPPQPYSEQYEQPAPAPAAPSSKASPEDDSGEFGGLVSYFSSQREEELDT